jgi:hypothetical protein
VPSWVVAAGIIALLGLLAVLLLVGCDTGPGVRADRIRVGQCYDDAAPEVQRFDVVPCDESHDNEVYFLFEAPGADYPGKEALADLAATRCTGSAFTRYVGVALEDSDLRTFEVVPSNDTWEHDADRQVVCVLHAPGGRPIVGSARKGAQTGAATSMRESVQSRALTNASSAKRRRSAASRA